jgi:tetratricopeptide (TPR) repeat protein
LAADASQVLPTDNQPVSAARRFTGKVALGVSGVFAVGIFAWIGLLRYEDSRHLLQPGVDPRREQQALQAFNAGAAEADRKDLEAAEKSFAEALLLWEHLTSGVSTPREYKVNLALTLYNLGWINHEKQRLDQAEHYYARALAVGEALGPDPELDTEFRKSMVEARAILAGFRARASTKLLRDKDKAAVRTYEEAQVKEDQEPAQAESLYRQAIGSWEEILAEATADEYRAFAVARLATAWLVLADLERRLGKAAEVEPLLKKSISYGEQALAAAPDRPLVGHNLEIARRMLEAQGEQALEEAINKACAAENFGAARDLQIQKLDELEGKLRSGTDRVATSRRLAYRLERFAWFLAHCPDARLRDTKAAIKRARRATQLQPEDADYWLTLAVVQYRDGDWKESLGSLDQVKSRAGEHDATGWLWIAMNRQQLKQRAEAKNALRKAVEWIDERRRRAEDNAGLRLQLELMRPGLEALRREAEQLIDGKVRATTAWVNELWDRCRGHPWCARMRH